MATENEICCKTLLPEEWNKKIITWKDKPFLRTRYAAFLHIPINLGSKITSAIKKVNDFSLAAEPMVICKNDGMWGADLLIPIREKTHFFETELVSGRFLTCLFEGHYSEMNKWIRETKILAAQQGLKIRQFLFWYATCPKCAKKKGDKVQVVVLAQVD